MIKEIKFSIINVNLNMAVGLQKTIQSVAGQTYKNIEYIVIDGDSTEDNSKDVINQNRSVITKWISEKDTGIYNAMNKGINLSTGDYLLFLNSGDTFVNEHVLEDISKQKLGKSIYFGNLMVDKNDGKELFRVNFDKQKYNLSFFLNYTLPHQATIYHKDLFKKYGLYDETLKICGDLEYYLRLVEEKVEVKYIPIDIAIFDETGKSHSESSLERINKEKALLFEKYYGYPSIHFMTIVLNGQPFIEYHINILKKLPFKWHWHIIEGLADLTHDTAWSKTHGATVPQKFQKNGRSIDGTAEYIDNIAKQFPENITVYRKKGLWDGKTEMVSAPLKNMKEACILFQIDSDEIWTLEQLIDIRNLFKNNLQKHSAYFLTDFFFGEKLVLINFNKYGNNLDQEWLRVWRYQPGDRWVSHEPPRLVRSMYGADIDVAKINPFTHIETESHELIFQHYPYVTKQQIEFKSQYYGDRSLVTKWEELQKVKSFPVKLKDYYNLVTDDTLVDIVKSQGISPILIKSKTGKWEITKARKEKDHSLNDFFHQKLSENVGMQISKVNREKNKLETLLYERSNQLNQINEEYNRIVNSKGWKIILTVRNLFNKLKTLLK